MDPLNHANLIPYYYGQFLDFLKGLKLKERCKGFIELFRSFNKWKVTTLFYEFDFTVRYCLIYSKGCPTTQETLPSLYD